MSAYPLGSLGQLWLRGTPTRLARATEDSSGRLIGGCCAFVVVGGDYTLVTHNSRDFRGTGPAAPGGLYANEPIHAGLVCLNSAYAMDIERQCDLFGIALGKLARLGDLVNHVIEVFEDEDGTVRVVLYGLPGA